MANEAPITQTMGDLTIAVDELKGAAADIFEAYENDAPPSDLSESAQGLLNRAIKLRDTFDGIAGALSNL